MFSCVFLCQHRAFPHVRAHLVAGVAFGIAGGSCKMAIASLIDASVAPGKIIFLNVISVRFQNVELTFDLGNPFHVYRIFRRSVLCLLPIESRRF